MSPTCQVWSQMTDVSQVDHTLSPMSLFYRVRDRVEMTLTSIVKVKTFFNYYSWVFVPLYTSKSLNQSKKNVKW